FLIPSNRIRFIIMVGKNFLYLKFLQQLLKSLERGIIDTKKGRIMLKQFLVQLGQGLVDKSDPFVPSVRQLGKNVSIKNKEEQHWPSSLKGLIQSMVIV